MKDNFHTNFFQEALTNAMRRMKLTYFRNNHKPHLIPYIRWNMQNLDVNKTFFSIRNVSTNSHMKRETETVTNYETYGFNEIVLLRRDQVSPPNINHLTLLQWNIRHIYRSNCSFRNSHPCSEACCALLNMRHFALQYGAFIQQLLSPFLC